VTLPLLISRTLDYYRNFGGSGGIVKKLARRHNISYLETNPYLQKYQGKLTTLSL